MKYFPHKQLSAILKTKYCDAENVIKISYKLVGGGRQHTKTGLFIQKIKHKPKKKKTTPCSSLANSAFGLQIK